jgi:hypothetical protein
MTRRPLIYLTGSNARELYLRDMLSVVGSPKGQAVHYRYRSKWVDRTLRSELPVGVSQGGSVFHGCRFMILFLEQKLTDASNSRIWAALFPLRFATPVCCYKTGDTEEDYCHFYFSLGDFAEPRNLPVESFDQKLFAAFLPSSFSNGKDKLEECAFNESGFIRPTNFLSEEDPASLGNRFKSLETGQSYVPVFVGVFGINRGMAFGRPQPIKPFHNNDVRGCLYILKEDSLYSIWVSVATPIAPAGQPTIRLKFNEKDFFGLSVERLELSSRYDSHCFGITSLSGDAVRETFLAVNVDLPEERDADHASARTGEKTPLSTSIQIPLRLQPLIGRKVAKWVEELFLVLVTTSLAVIGILAKGAQPTAFPGKSIVSDPLLLVLWLVVPLFVTYLVIKFKLLWNWRYYISSALASFSHKIRQRHLK